MFSKSERFKENNDIIPPVGAYNVGSDFAKHGSTFDKSGRFRQSSPIGDQIIISFTLVYFNRSTCRYRGYSR
jgi:hypothetical protein